MSEHLPKKDAINLRRKRIAKLLGIELSDEQVVDILERLGMELSATDDGWKVQPPSYRFDIAIEEDLIEELVRIYGYNRVPSRVPQNDMKMVPRPERLIAKDAIREVLVDRGYQEAITYSFVEPDMLKTIVPDTPSIDLLNPISSDLATMRTSLLPGLIATAQHNLNRQQDSIKIFEMGLRFENHVDELKQIPTLAGLVAGFHLAESWEGAPREVDFYDLKGDLESVINLTVNSEAYRYKIESQSSLHPGQSARIYLKKRPVGWIGKVHPSVQKQLDIEPALFVFEIDLSAIEQRKLPKFADLARSPSIRRDLALIVDESVSSAQLVDLIRQTGGNLLKSTHVFDIYRGDSVGEGKKSVAIAMVLQHAERTLKDAEVTQITDKIVERLKTSVGAVLRD